MKISEIVIDDNKIIFDKIINEDITNTTVQLYNFIKIQTNGFSELPHERYPPEVLHDITVGVMEVENEIKEYFSHHSETYKIIEWLIYYLKS